MSSLDWKDRHSMQADIATLARGRALLDETPVHEWTRLIIRATAAHWRWVADNDSP